MSDANSIEVTAYLDGTNDEKAETESLTMVIEQIPARSTSRLNIMLKDISPQIMTTLSQSIYMGSIVRGRIGLNIDFKISVDGKTSERMTVYLPFEDNSVQGKHMLSLA